MSALLYYLCEALLSLLKSQELGQRHSCYIITCMHGYQLHSKCKFYQSSHIVQNSLYQCALCTCIEFLSDDLRCQQKIDRIWKEAEMQMSRQVFFFSCCSAVSKSNRDLNTMLLLKQILNHLKTTSTQFAPIHVPAP